MDWYLTDKARKRRAWEIPAAGVSLLFGIVAVHACITDPPEGDPFITLLAALVVIGLFLWPFFAVFKTWVRRYAAKRLALRFARSVESQIPFCSFTIRERKWIRVLLAKGFLRNVYYSEVKEQVELDRPRDHAVKAEPEEGGQEEETLRRIRSLNDAIENEAVSRRIERIEKVTGSIFRTVRERPERAGDARRFMNYYLPTTLKLLDSYRLLEGQSYQGENVSAARQSIEEALEKLTEAIERQQDKLYLPEMMDVESNIRVIETMMAADGLNREKTELKV